MATLLADSPPAPSDEQSTPGTPASAQPAAPNGAAPAPNGSAHALGGGTPAPAGAAAQPSAPAPVAHACARCNEPMAPGQDWCLQCGAGAPGSIGTPGWRSAASILTATAVLAVGAAAAAYAALSKGAPAKHIVTTTVARAVTPTSTLPQNTVPQTTFPNSLGTASTPQPLPHTKVKPPKIPLVAGNIPQQTTTTPTNTGASETTPTTPTGSGGGTEPKPVAIVLDTNAASTYNPYAYPASAFGDPSLTIDGDTSTAWNAQVDPAKAPDMAEGILIDLKAQQKLTALTLVTSTPGVTVQVYGTSSQTAPTSIVDPAWVPLSHSRVVKKKHVRIVLKHPTKAFNFITLWISKAPASSTPAAPGHVSINEIELFPVE